MTVEQKKSRQQSSYFPETKASLKKKYYGEFVDVSVVVLTRLHSRVVIAEDDAVIDDKPETMSTNPQNVPKGINRLSCKSDTTFNRVSCSSVYSYISICLIY